MISSAERGRSSAQREPDNASSAPNAYSNLSQALWQVVSEFDRDFQTKHTSREVRRCASQGGAPCRRELLRCRFSRRELRVLLNVQQQVEHAPEAVHRDKPADGARYRQ